MKRIIYFSLVLASLIFTTSVFAWDATLDETVPEAVADDEESEDESSYTDGLMLGIGFGFASGPLSIESDASFEGVGGFFYVGRQVSSWLALGGKFEWYSYENTPNTVYYTDNYDQALYDVGVMSRFYPVSFAKIRPFIGLEAGVYVRMFSESSYYNSEIYSKVTPGATGRGGLEIFIFENFAIDFGASYSLDNETNDRLEILTGYAGGVLYL